MEPDGHDILNTAAVDVQVTALQALEVHFIAMRQHIDRTNLMNKGSLTTHALSN